MEVSSPGLGRTLKKDKHLEKSLGQEVDLRTYKPVNGSKDFSGTLQGFDGETITIRCGEEELVFNRKDVAVVKLAFDF